MKNKIRHPFVILAFITLLGAVLRLYNINWGDGEYFHPDERNIIFGISNIDLNVFPEYLSNLPNMSTYEGAFSSWINDLKLEEMPLNPQFWAYGSLPIYIVYMIAFIGGFFGIDGLNTFEGYIIIGRLLSALCSIALIPLVYYLTQRILSRNRLKHIFALLSSLWVAFLPGMIQFAHFMTFETFLTLQYTLILIAGFNIVEHGKKRDYLLFGVILGLSVGTKIVSLALVPLLLGSHSIRIYNTNRTLSPIKYFTNNIVLALMVAGLFTFVASPFHFLDINGFLNSLNYESGVANGSIPVFYTQQFIDTIPVLYQLTRVFPYVLTIPLTIFGLVAFIYFSVVCIKRATHGITKHKKLSNELSFVILLIMILVLYLGFHMTMYVKWTRYMIPALPFLAILISLAGFITIRKRRLMTLSTMGIISIWVIFSGVSFWQIYTKTDTRIQAAEWAKEGIGYGTPVTSEIYDLGIIPFNNSIGAYAIELLPLYDLEAVPNTELIFYQRDRSQFFIVLSQRLYATRYRLPEQYPLGFLFYNNIFYSRDWRIVADFHRNSADCNLFTLYCMGGLFPPDETFNVFDHPRLMIYENVNFR